MCFTETVVTYVSVCGIHLQQTISVLYKVHTCSRTGIYLWLKKKSILSLIPRGNQMVRNPVKLNKDSVG